MLLSICWTDTGPAFSTAPTTTSSTENTGISGTQTVHSTTATNPGISSTQTVHTTTASNPGEPVNPVKVVAEVGQSTTLSCPYPPNWTKCIFVKESRDHEVRLLLSVFPSQ